MTTNGEYDELKAICGQCTHNAERFAATTNELISIKRTTYKTNSKIKKIINYIHYLEKLPEIASSIKILAWGNLLLVSVLSIFVLVILMRGTDMNFKIPGWLELGANHETNK